MIFEIEKKIDFHLSARQMIEKYANIDVTELKKLKTNNPKHRHARDFGQKHMARYC